MVSQKLTFCCRNSDLNFGEVGGKKFVKNLNDVNTPPFYSLLHAQMGSVWPLASLRRALFQILSVLDDRGMEWSIPILQIVYDIFMGSA